MRTFIAIELSKESINFLISEQDRLNKLCPENLKLMAKDNLHLTLKFLGDTERGKIEKIKSILQETVSDIKPFSLKLKASGAFPSLDKPRVIWTGIEEPENQLRQIAEALDLKLSELDFQTEEREFHPHVTIARAGRGARPIIPAEFFNTQEGPEELVKKISLIKSDLKPDKAEYTTLISIDL